MSTEFRGWKVCSREAGRGELPFFVFFLERGEEYRNMMTEADFRRIALSMEGAEERSHMVAADFRVGGRIFATLASLEQGYGNLMLTRERQAEFLTDRPDLVLPIHGGWGRLPTKNHCAERSMPPGDARRKESKRRPAAQKQSFDYKSQITESVLPRPNLFPQGSSDEGWCTWFRGRG